MIAVAGCKSLVVGKPVYASVSDENLSTNLKSVVGVTQPGGVSVGRAKQRKWGVYLR